MLNSMKDRIDKIISLNLNIARSEAKSLIKNGAVSVNGSVITDSGEKYDYSTDCIFVNGKNISAKKYTYIMLNKPRGVVSASKDDKTPTVIDILPDKLKRKNLFPAGRLDKDTTGFCLITDDGDFAHRILSPSNHVKKTYIAEVSEKIDFEKAAESFKKGVVLSDGTVLLSAELELISDERHQVFKVTVKEGKYHQIKRMFASLGTKVVALKRIAIGGLFLDGTLSEGEAREISGKELEIITGLNE